MKRQIGVSMIGVLGLSSVLLDKRPNPFGDVVLKDCDKDYGPNSSNKLFVPPPVEISNEEHRLGFATGLFDYNDATMLLAKRQLFEVDGYMVASLNLKGAVKALNGLKRRFGQ